MKIIDGIITVFSHQVRGCWHVIQDMICLCACILASSVSFPYHVRANNLFIFFTWMTLIIFFYKICRTDAYEKSVRTLGAWGAKYRCFYAIYYPMIAFLCASLGGFKGYSFALIWILSGGTYLVVADKIARTEKVKQETVAEEISGKREDAESGCPYCKSQKFTENTCKKIINQLKINNTCRTCGKDWTEVYQFEDIELKREDLPIEDTIGDEVFGTE